MSVFEIFLPNHSGNKGTMYRISKSRTFRPSECVTMEATHCAVLVGIFLGRKFRDRVVIIAIQYFPKGCVLRDENRWQVLIQT